MTKEKKINKIPFCSKCGSRLVLQKRDVTYNNKTGRKMFSDFYVCPKDKGLFSHGHNTASKPYWQKEIEIDEDWGLI
jgi:hypothetical protein